MNGSPLQLALRELRRVFASRPTRFGLVLAIVVLTASGPFGTFASFNLGQRFAYWAVMVLACYATGQAAAAIFIDILKRWIGQRWPRTIVAGLLSAVPVTAVVYVINGVARQDFGSVDILSLWLYTTLITLAVVVMLVVLDEQLRPAVPAGPAATVVPAGMPAPPAILERVPLPMRGRLLALTVEDHYVDIVTERGKTLVLMRLADAMRETGGVAGLQIHRSHWVARDAVVKTHRADGKVMLELSNGMRLPVSRGFLPVVRESGLG